MFMLWGLSKDETMDEVGAEVDGGLSPSYLKGGGSHRFFTRGGNLSEGGFRVRLLRARVSLLCFAKGGKRCGSVALAK